MIKTTIFVLVSLGFVLKERKYLTNPRVHGFYRFFAFEAVFLLILVNVNVWFQYPFNPFQIISWLLLAASIIVVTHGFYLLNRVGQPEGEFENTTNLVKVGAYKYIRHPLYCSLLLLAWGAFFKHISILSSTLVLVATAFLYATALVEERENLDRFGVEYEYYMKTTRMFIPLIF